MNRIIQVLFLLNFFLEAHGEATIKGKILGWKNEDVSINLPVNGFSNYNIKIFDYKILLDSNHFFVKSIQIEDPLFVTLNVGNNVIWLLLSPNDSLNLQIDIRNISAAPNNSWLIVKGNNAAGQMYFNEFNYYPINKLLPVINYFNNKYQLNHSDVIKFTRQYIEKSISGFDSLLKNNKISKIFYDISSLSVKAAIVSEVMKRYTRPSKLIENASFHFLDSVRNSVLSIVDHTDTLLFKGLLTYLYIEDFYLNSFLHFHRLRTINDLQDSSLIKSGGEKLIIRSYFTPYLFIQNKRLRENIWGKELCFVFSYAPFAIDSNDLVAFKFCTSENAYLSFVYSEITRRDKYNLENSAPIRFLDSTSQMNSIKQIVETYFKNENVFVDCWATWCSPCISEFAFNGQLDSFLNKQQIKKLYISFDELDVKENVSFFIHKYDLRGYHLIAGKKLKSDLSKLIFGNTLYSIPRYFIINKSGEIIEKDADRPSSGNKLFVQITDKLKIE
jgi:thiol-disulfide isomerase/thioredoxin